MELRIIYPFIEPEGGPGGQVLGLSCIFTLVAVVVVVCCYSGLWKVVVVVRVVVERCLGGIGLLDCDNL